MKLNGKNFWVFDNGGETVDRFTIVLSNGDILGSSCFPFHPQGFGQYCGNWIDSHFTQTYGASWNHRLNVSRYQRMKVLQNNLNAVREEKNLGIEITDINEIPKDVIKFIQQSL